MTRQDALEKILLFVSEYTKIPVSLIASKSRKTEVVEARHLYHYFGTKHALRLKDSEICILSGRNRSTVIHSTKQVNNMQFSNATFRSTLDDMTEIFTAMFELNDFKPGLKSNKLHENKAVIPYKSTIKMLEDVIEQKNKVIKDYFLQVEAFEKEVKFLREFYNTNKTRILN